MEKQETPISFIPSFQSLFKQSVSGSRFNEPISLIFWPI